MFREVFAIDKAAGALSSLRAPAAGVGRMAVDQLSMRCRRRLPDYDSLLPLVYDALDLPKWTLPAPPAVPPPPSAGPSPPAPQARTKAAKAEGRVKLNSTADDALCPAITLYEALAHESS